MNDPFLSNFREQPRPKYADALYQRINKPMKATYRPSRLLALGVSASALALFLILALSPTVRVYAQTLFFQIGRLFITQEPTYAEQFESKINNTTPTPLPTGSPVPVEWLAPPLLSLAEASSQAHFSVAEISELPHDLPPVARFVSLPDETNFFTRVTTSYATAEQILVLSQTAYQTNSQLQNLPAGNATVTPITIQGVSGLWIENLRLSTYVDQNNQVAPQFANIVIWEKNGFEYSLQSTPGLSQEEMLRIANSLKP